MKRFSIFLAVFVLVCGISSAQDITTQFTLKVVKGTLNFTKTKSGSYSLTNSNPNVAGVTMNVLSNSTGTAVPLGNVVTNGVAWFANVGTVGTNTIEVGVVDSLTNFLPFVRLNTNEAWCCRLSPQLVPYARSTNDTVVMEYYIFDN